MATGGFRIIHGDIGVSEHGISVHPALGEDADADAGGDLDLALFPEGKRCLKGAQKLSRALFCRRGRVEVGYAATQNFLKLREKYPQYAYKEATLNPTNPRDRAADWEADIIQRFRNDPGVHELSGVRDTPMGPSLYMARPITADAECLQCHSRPALAPATMLARYGSDNGFGWQANEIVGAQVVSVPFGRANNNIEKSLSSFMLVILAALLALWLMVNIVLYVQVQRPLRRIATLADGLSLGQGGDQEFPRKGAREVVALGGAFERMRKSLDKAMKLLGS